MNKYDLSEEALEHTFFPSKLPHIITGSPHITWENAMSCAPRHKFFRTPGEQKRNMEERLSFLHVLEKRARVSGNFRITDEFVKDFVERND